MNLVQAKCTNCGANIEVNPQKEAGICPYCNTAYITQKAIINYNTTIINNNTIQADTVNIVGANADNIMKTAKEAWDGANYPDAYDKFSKVLELNPDNEEALLYKSLCAGWDKSNFRIIQNAYHTTFDNIDFKSATPKKIEQLNYFLCALNDLLIAYYNVTIKMYNPNYFNINSIQNAWNRMENIIIMSTMMIDYQKKIKDKSDIYLKNYIIYLKELLKYYQTICGKWTYNTHRTGGLIDIKIVKHPEKEQYERKKEEVLNEIRKYEPEFQPTEKKGCYIATAVYGSYNCAPVWVLRRYRDYKLSKTFFGRVFIKLYYGISPTMIKLCGNRKWFQNFWKNKLDKFVEKLKDKGFEDTPYQDKS